MKMHLTLRKGWDVVAEGTIQVNSDFLVGKDKNRSAEAQELLFGVERAINAGSNLRATLEVESKRKK